LNLYQTASLPSSSKGDFNISNARLQNLNIASDSVLLTQGDGFILSESKITSLDVLADVQRGNDRFKDTSF
jgi:hypothetical protein